MAAGNRLYDAVRVLGAAKSVLGRSWQLANTDLKLMLENSSVLSLRVLSDKQDQKKHIKRPSFEKSPSSLVNDSDRVHAFTGIPGTPFELTSKRPTLQHNIGPSEVRQYSTKKPDPVKVSLFTIFKFLY